MRTSWLKTIGSAVDVCSPHALQRVKWTFAVVGPSSTWELGASWVAQLCCSTSLQWRTMHSRTVEGHYIRVATIIVIYSEYWATMNVAQLNNSVWIHRWQCSVGYTRVCKVLKLIFFVHPLLNRLWFASFSWVCKPNGLSFFHWMVRGITQPMLFVIVSLSLQVQLN